MVMNFSSTLSSVRQFGLITSLGILFKALQRISRVEGSKLSTDDLKKIAENSEGDLRHAINTLQLWHTPTSQRRESGEEGVKEKVKDDALSSFHGIGKILHGKLLGMIPNVHATLCEL